jgi:YD repeat-containing protein
LEEIVRIRYDAQVDILSIVFNDRPVEESDEEKPDLILDYDKDGNIVSVEILDASKHIENPKSLDYAVAG